MSDRLDSLTDELTALRNANGLINPVEAVNWARRNRKSKLHAHLTWDDGIAGERYRVWQIRELISVHIVDNEGGRRFVSLSVDRGTGGYRPIGEIIGRVDLREIMVADALADLERMQRRYEKLTELQTIWAAADEVKAQRKRPKAA
jgi:hypothetical protein